MARKSQFTKKKKSSYLVFAESPSTDFDKHSSEVRPVKLARNRGKTAIIILGVQRSTKTATQRPFAETFRSPYGQKHRVGRALRLSARGQENLLWKPPVPAEGSRRCFSRRSRTSKGARRTSRPNGSSTDTHTHTISAINNYCAGKSSARSAKECARKEREEKSRSAIIATVCCRRKPRPCGGIFFFFFRTIHTHTHTHAVLTYAYGALLSSSCARRRFNYGAVNVPWNVPFCSPANGRF